MALIYPSYCTGITGRSSLVLVANLKPIGQILKKLCKILLGKVGCFWFWQWNLKTWLSSSDLLIHLREGKLHSDSYEISQPFLGIKVKEPFGSVSLWEGKRTWKMTCALDDQPQRQIRKMWMPNNYHSGDRGNSGHRIGSSHFARKSVQ